MKSLPKLSNSEWDVVKPLWDEGPLHAKDVYAVVSRSQSWAYKTVKTMLARLVAKGVLRYEKEGNAYRYYPNYTREALTRDATEDFIMRVFDGRPEDIILLAAEGLPKGRLKEVRGRLKKLSREKKSQV